MATPLEYHSQDKVLLIEPFGCCAYVPPSQLTLGMNRTDVTDPWNRPLAGKMASLLSDRSQGSPPIYQEGTTTWWETHEASELWDYHWTPKCRMVVGNLILEILHICEIRMDRREIPGKFAAIPSLLISWTDGACEWLGRRGLVIQPCGDETSIYLEPDCIICHCWWVELDVFVDTAHSTDEVFPATSNSVYWLWCFLTHASAASVGSIAVDTWPPVRSFTH